jgi:hypothetical protein
MQKQTITIKTFFGEKTVGIDEYEKKWVDTINELFWLTNSREDIDKCKQMKKWVGEMARADFENGLAKERGKDHAKD